MIFSTKFLFQIRDYCIDWASISEMKRAAVSLDFYGAEVINVIYGHPIKSGDAVGWGKGGGRRRRVGGVRGRGITGWRHWRFPFFFGFVCVLYFVLNPPLPPAPPPAPTPRSHLRRIKRKRERERERKRKKGDASHLFFSFLRSIVFNLCKWVRNDHKLISADLPLTDGFPDETVSGVFSSASGWVSIRRIHQGDAPGSVAGCPAWFMRRM